jgi:acyl-CoA synthetase (AMP-forming)/AMP-acid ligase II/acyl carrier protein
MNKPAIVEGPVCVPMDQLPTDMASGIAARVESLPDGRLWQYDLQGEHRSRDYRSLWELAGRLAGVLQSRGAGRETPVVLLLDDVLHFVVGFWACLRAGCPAVPLNALGLASLRGRSLEPILPTIQELEPLAVIGDDRFRAVCEQLQEKGFAIVDLSAPEEIGSIPLSEVMRDHEDLVCIMPSSGTTGSAKLVSISERAMLARVFAGSSGLRDGREATALNWFSLDSITGLSSTSLQYREFVHVPTQVATTEPLVVLDGIERFRVSYVHMNSYLADRICSAVDDTDRHWNLSSLQRIGFGSEAIVPSVVRRFAELLKQHGASATTLVAGYGMSEVGLIAMRELDLDAGSAQSSTATIAVGPPVRGVSIRIVDDDGRILSESQSGHIQVWAPTKIFSGYFGRPEWTRAGFTDDGWFKTADRGVLANGQLTVTGRFGDTFIFAGKNYGLTDVEVLVRARFGSRVLGVSAVVLRASEGATESLAVFFEPVHRSPSQVGGLIRGMKRAVQEQIGVPVQHWVPLWVGQIPRTANGKVQRAQLADRFRAGTLHTVFIGLDEDVHPKKEERERDSSRLIAAIWQRVLHLERLPDPDDDFFDHGGHSLASADLIANLERELGVKIQVGDFFARPTFGQLVAMVSRDFPHTTTVIEKPPWPLPGDLYQRLHSFVAAWDGERRTSGSLVSVLNAGGTKMPLAWVFQSTKEFSRLARALGNDQPLYGMRSGSQIMDYGEANVQALALVYAQELQELCVGPFVLGGNCQGGIIALAVAQHLLRRRRHVPLLVLMEWSFAPVSYPEQVLLLFGRESQAANPFLRYKYPEMGWRRAFPRHSWDFISGPHGHFFETENVASLSGVLARHLASATRSQPTLMPACAYHASISIDASMPSLECGRRAALRVTVRNDGCLGWREFESSGLMLAARWLTTDDSVLVWRDGGVPLAALGVGEEVTITLHVQPPQGDPIMRLMIDLVEEGYVWFHRLGSRPFQSEVAIAPCNPTRERWSVRHSLSRIFNQARRLIGNQGGEDKHP